MAGTLRFLLAGAALPLAWGVTRSLVDVMGEIPAEGGAVVPLGVVAVIAGLVAQLAVWKFLPLPVRAYVLGHELTHALWGLLFGARVSKLRVGTSGGSVTLSKSNVWITLAPYFFPFYTFVVIVVALITYAFIRPLPCLPLWMFLVGFTWAFHALFTLETLTQRQPDVKLYGRIFSWVFIFLVNILIILVWLATMTPLAFADLGHLLLQRTCDAYVGVGWFAWQAVVWLKGRFASH